MKLDRWPQSAYVNAWRYFHDPGPTTEVILCGLCSGLGYTVETKHTSYDESTTTHVECSRCCGHGRLKRITKVNYERME